MECFDLKTKQWVLKKEMSTPRRGIALAVVEVFGSQCIFAIGGLDDQMCYNNVERYDPGSDTWTNVAMLSIHRGGVCAVTLNNEVYAIGKKILLEVFWINLLSRRQRWSSEQGLL